MMNRVRECFFPGQDRRSLSVDQGTRCDRDSLLEGGTGVDTLSPPATHASGRRIALAVVLIEVTLALAMSLLYLAGNRSTNSLQTLLGLLTPLLHPPLVYIALTTILGGGVAGALFFIGLVVLYFWVSPRGSRWIRIDISTSLLSARSTAQHEFDAEKKGGKSQQLNVETSLIHIVAQLLHLPKEQVKASSDFFQLGGDADTLGELLSAIERLCQVRLAPSEVFDHPVLCRLALMVSTQWETTQQSSERHA